MHVEVHTHNRAPFLIKPVYYSKPNILLILRSIYFANVESDLNYCSSIGSKSGAINPLVILQEKHFEL